MRTESAGAALHVRRCQKNTSEAEWRAAGDTRRQAKKLLLENSEKWMGRLFGNKLARQQKEIRYKNTSSSLSDTQCGTRRMSPEKQKGS